MTQHKDTFSPLHAEYLQLMAEVCKDQPLAFKWFTQVLDAALLWDHVVDGDPVDLAKANSTFTALTMDWVLNDWFHERRLSLVPVINGCVAAWKGSAPGSLESYYAYTQLPAVMCLLLHGQAGVDHYMPRIYDLVRRERFEDMRRDHPPFLIVGLPRSRTAWLAAFLTGGDVTCHHELIRNCGSADDYPTALALTGSPIVGDADPTLPLVYPFLKDRLPPHKVVFIIRDPEQARNALMRVVEGEGQSAEEHMKGWFKLETAFEDMRRSCPDSMTFKYEDLEKPEVVSVLSEYCTGLPFSAERWRIFNELKITAIPSKVMANQRLIK